MGAKQSKNNFENEFIFENPLLQPETTTFQLPKKKNENKSEIPNGDNSNNKNDEPDNKNNRDIPNTENVEINNNTENNEKIEDIPEIKTEINEVNKDINEDKDLKKDKNIKYIEEPLPIDNDTYKPLDLMKPDKILTPEDIERIIEEHVNEELHRIQNENKIKNFRRDKLLERTINIINYGNSNFNYKDINDKYRKSQKRVLECINNNSQCTLSERDIACYQEFEEFKDNIRILYKKYYKA